MSVEILPIVTKNVGKEGSHTLEGALAGGIYQGIQRILDEKPDPAEVIETVKASSPSAIWNVSRWVWPVLRSRYDPVKASSSRALSSAAACPRNISPAWKRV